MHLPVHLEKRAPHEEKGARDLRHGSDAFVRHDHAPADLDAVVRAIDSATIAASYISRAAMGFLFCACGAGNTALHYLASRGDFPRAELIIETAAAILEDVSQHWKQYLEPQVLASLDETALGKGEILLNKLKRDLDLPSLGEYLGRLDSAGRDFLMVADTRGEVSFLHAFGGSRFASLMHRRSSSGGHRRDKDTHHHQLSLKYQKAHRNTAKVLGGDSILRPTEEERAMLTEYTRGVNDNVTTYH
ncbi:unnamed protein product [Amoebophrya sp. A25]|nr:unnamed protein product [Amoebophrya sp. A25]|eukprot:GSA25T00000185001.1